MTGDQMDIVLPEAPLKAAMIRYGLNVLALSVIISIITAALVYFTLNSLFVQPMMRITRNILRFSQNPEDASRIMVPSQRWTKSAPRSANSRTCRRNSRIPCSRKIASPRWDWP
ncbi:MAG: hypothetical protein HC868_17900 [Sphingomonadales bacterium]|nr:hypothetical protein [Sphingomonadales bacterium]